MSCKDGLDYKFPDYILKNYEGIMDQECLDGVRG